METKKGEGLPIRMIIITIICIVVLVIIVFIFQKQMGTADTDLGASFTCQGRGGTCIAATGNCGAGMDKVCGVTCAANANLRCCCVPSI
ncbi:hypothetical protein JXB11_01130 [Candidatus Woesearchaeota archaeon]|nr:hypothetical protein [Candidatus Woesearchaeota archaeon]